MGAGLDPYCDKAVVALGNDVVISSMFIPAEQFERETPLLINVRREGIPA